MDRLDNGYNTTSKTDRRNNKHRRAKTHRKQRAINAKSAISNKNHQFLFKRPDDFSAADNAAAVIAQRKQNLSVFV
jgi:hypothetical protein